VFETLFRLIAGRLSDSRMTDAEGVSKISGAGIRLRREVVNYSVYRSPRALHHIVRHVLSGYRSVLRHMSRRASRPRLHASSANGECEND
jgi:hypothetical protein